MLKHLSAAAALMLLAGCIGNYRPMVDLKGVDADQYEQDRQECVAIVKEGSPSAGAGLAVGLLAGGLAGAASGAAVGAATGAGAGYGSKVGTAALGSAGGLAGAGGAWAAQTAAVRNCLLGRGYRVLG